MGLDTSSAPVSVTTHPPPEPKRRATLPRPRTPAAASRGARPAAPAYRPDSIGRPDAADQPPGTSHWREDPGPPGGAEPDRPNPPSGPASPRCAPAAR